MTHLKHAFFFSKINSVNYIIDHVIVTISDKTMSDKTMSDKTNNKTLSDEDKLILEVNRLKQIQEKFVNRADIEKWAARGYSYKEDEEVLGIYKLTCSLEPLQSLNKLGSLQYFLL